MRQTFIWLISVFLDYRKYHLTLLTAYSIVQIPSDILQNLAKADKYILRLKQSELMKKALFSACVENDGDLCNIL